MHLGIIIPLVVLPLVLVGAYAWYRRSISAMKLSETKPPSGLRLTAEALHRAPSPLWRVVYEIGENVRDVDHVVIGPPGVIAITTIVGDRPMTIGPVDRLDEARQMSAAAITRAAVDDLLVRVGLSCSLSATVYWGTPDPGRPSHDATVATVHLVEGQRISDWLDQLAATAPSPLDQSRVDAAWRNVAMGIGRPDPVA